MAEIWELAQTHLEHLVLSWVGLLAESGPEAAEESEEAVQQSPQVLNLFTLTPEAAERCGTRGGMSEGDEDEDDEEGDDEEEAEGMGDSGGRRQDRGGKGAGGEGGLLASISLRESTGAAEARHSSPKDSPWLASMAKQRHLPFVGAAQDGRDGFDRPFKPLKFSFAAAVEATGRDGAGVDEGEDASSSSPLSSRRRDSPSSPSPDTRPPYATLSTEESVRLRRRAPRLPSSAYTHLSLRAPSSRQASR